MRSGSAPGRPAIVRAIVVKDLKEFTRDRLWMVLTPLVLAAFIAVFWLMPSSVEESIVIGVHQRNMEDVTGMLKDGNSTAVAESGLAIVEFDTPEALVSAVAGRTDAEGPGGEKLTVPVGVDFGSEFTSDVAAGRQARVTVYVSGEAPVEYRGAVAAFVREMAYALAGDELPVSMPAASEVILGEDRAGRQVPFRERMRPILVFIVLLTESFALSSLVASEIRDRTAAAILVTPASAGDLVTAKTVTGTCLAVGQAVVLLAATGSFTGRNWAILLVAALLGAVLATGVGVLSGSAGRDFMGTLFIGMAFLVPMMVPAFEALFPGSGSAWVKVIPSYGIVQAIVGIVTYGEGWADVWLLMLTAAAWSVALCAIGVFALGRKVAAL